MAFCPNCGASVPDGAAVCPGCGASLGGAPQGYQQAYQQQPYAQQPYPQYYSDVPPGFDTEDIQKNRALSFFCYLGPMAVLIPLVAQPDSKYCRYHANQGLVLMVFELLCALVCIVPILGWIVGGIAGIFAFVCEIIGIVNALTGKVKPLPIIGKYTILN